MMDKKLVIGIIVVLILCGVIAYTLNDIIHNDEVKSELISTYEKKLGEQRAENTANLNATIKSMSRHKALRDAMTARDSAVSQLPAYTGQIVMIKPDSTVGVIQDVIIGGNEYEYFVRYRINTVKGEFVEVSPEMIYK